MLTSKSWSTPQGGRQLPRLCIFLRPIKDQRRLRGTSLPTFRLSPKTAVDRHRADPLRTGVDSSLYVYPKRNRSDRQRKREETLEEGAVFPKSYDIEFGWIRRFVTHASPPRTPSPNIANLAYSRTYSWRARHHGRLHLRKVYLLSRSPPF
ncbi:uncharacterized protein LY79DRAFT_345820 [Colletotrichum navitas]|uniref:Uncharacterized protein n=1 Tax=Colletotrichum navitas TaxID=681940 RepID=A0AAD8PSL3_9PEZI|nr:uncharacterized protein LY79DRAFT_345820 [Colletotrichum navitas]KAK1579287.1 hypothetical protein LY79DRAFT_345820 [Colletotrichum navitas]